MTIEVTIQGTAASGTRAHNRKQIMTDLSVDNSAIQRKVEKDYRWNFVVNAMDGGFFWFGASFISQVTILPLYISHFTDNPLLIGLIPFLSTGGYLLPQLFVANAVQRAPRKKYFPVNLGFFLQRVPILLLPLTAYGLAGDQPAVALAVFFALYTWFTVGSGLQTVGWQDMIAKIFPVDKRGRFFGITNFIGNAAGIFGALAVPFILEQYGFPLGYVVAFSIAAFLILLSWVALAMAREPASPTTGPRLSQMDYLRSLPAILGRDRNFRMYLLAQITFSLSGMAPGFLAVYAVQQWRLTDASASGFTLAMQIGLAAANLFFGFLADRRGHKLSLEISFVASTLSLLLAIVAPDPWVFFVIFFLRGAVNAGTFISGISIVYEFTGEESRATYIGLSNTLPGISGSIAPLLGGWLAVVIGYPAMFVLSTVVGAVAWALMRYAVRDPRPQAPAQPQTAVDR